MKKKLLALFLCCVMVFSLVPAALTSAFATGNGFQIYSSNGTVAETVLLQMSEKMDLTAVAETGSGNYQWQIRVSGDVWANIAGTNGNTLELSYGLVANALDNDAAEIRCKLTNDVGNVSYSNIVTVQIQPDSTVRRAPAASPAVGTVISEAQPIGEPVIVPADAPSYYNAPAANSEPVVNDTPTVSGESNTDAEPAPVSDDAAANRDDDSVLVNDPAPVNDTPANDAPANDPAPVNDTPANDAPANDPAPANDTPANDAPANDPAPVNDTPTNDAPANNPAPANDTPTNDVPADETPANDTPTPTTYTILINYIFADGKQAAPSWSATVATGSTYTQDIESPVVVGYTPNETVVHVNASEAATYTVTYQPAEVDFTVKHYQQNVSNDEYTLVDTETKKGYTEAAVGAGLAKTDYTGFYSLLYDTTTTIAADGSTVVEVYYDRYYYLMNFNLDGGYGVEPIYARFGSPISVDTPTKPGYTFESWTPSIPATMPDHNTSYMASWKIGESGFTVVFWYENANDDGYSVAGTYTPADVAPGTQKKSEDYKDQSFTGRDDKHFTYNAAKAETVTVKGDGSTVLNVYYTRNTYTLKFVDGTEEVLSCGKEEHTHSYTGKYKKGGFIGIGATTYYYGGCYPAGGKDWGGATEGNTICGKEEHTHKWRCYSEQPKVVKEITAKYQADIHGNFPIKDGDETIWWEVPSGCKSFKPGTQLGSIDTMPGENITFTRDDSESGAVIWYYVETLNGESGEYTHGGKNFKLYKKIDIEKSGYLTYTEEFHDITGFTQWWSDPSFSKMEQGGKTNGVNSNNYLCYTRNSYNLKFYNYNAYVDDKGGSVQYEAPLSSYYFEPEYPANLEKNAYVFDGWYTTAGCYEGSKADLNTMTMPASDVILYAKWVPKTHTVKAYQTKDALENGEDALHTYDNVPHGTTVTPTPADPKRDPYKFVGWFYISDTGEEKAFDFSMPVNRDLNLYAKWSSNTLMNYTIRYAIENADGTLTYIADDTTGSALAGSTKTFNAKTGTQLNEGYQSGYFPKVSSHSLTIDVADTSKNEFTFIYVAKAEVEYTVRYLEKGTGNVLADPKTVKTRDAVVTETFKQIKGYAPDAYQKQLVLAAEGNEIIFWYVKDDDHAPVQVIHWTQNIEGEGYTERQSSTNLNGVIGTGYSETPLTIAGFTYNGTKSNASGELTAAGLVLNLYYDRIEYPYEFRFVEKDSDPEKQLADSVTGSARYQAQVTQTAKTIPGYTLVSTENQAIHIAIEEGTTAVKNVKTFHYTEQTVDIKYEVVGPDDCGTLDNYQESQLKVTTGEVKGSTPTAADGFKFVGWYKDQDCTQPVDANWVEGSKLTPDKTKNYGTAEKPVMGYEAATYYAKFEYDVANLTITKQGWEAIDEGQSFIFDVTGPNEYSKRVVINGNGYVTIKGLKIGTYTVTEVRNWSWRYTADSSPQSIELKPAETNAVTFVNTRSNHKWLGGDAYKKNIFGN